MSAFNISIQLILCASILGISYADGSDAGTSYADGYDATPMQQAVDGWMTIQGAGCVAAAFVTPKATNYFFAGELGPGNPHLPNEDTIFEIGSITKGFTALLLADRVLAGNVTLNNTLAELLTDWPGRHSSEVGTVTLLELTTHSSGLPKLPPDFDDDSQNPYVNYTAERLYEWLNNETLPKRGLYNYSNVGVALLGHALAVHEGKDYEDFLKARVINPLELRDTAITLNENQTLRLPPGHNENGSVVPSWEYQDIFKPMIALRSSVVNMAQLVRFAIRKNDSESQVDIRKALEFTTRHFKPADPDFPYQTIGYNWQCLTLANCDKFIFHDGLTGGYNAFIGWHAEQQVGYVVLASKADQPSSAVCLGLALLSLGSGNGQYYGNALKYGQCHI